MKKRIEKILQDLNEKQQEAVTHKDGPVLVIAGPGTGKTRVITHRIAYLICQHSIKPDSILAITFTNKSAEEMNERVNNIIGEPSGSKVKVSTFHAFCNRLLRRHAKGRHAKEIGLDEDFRLIDKDEQDELLTRIVKDLNLSLKDYKVNRMLSINSNLKQNLKELTETTTFYENGMSIIEEEDHENIRTIINRYQNELEKLNALDFDDLLLKTVRLLKEFTDIRELYQNEISYILVDEFHDVNFAQYSLLQHLCEPIEHLDLPILERNIMIVADKDQAIYSWRGSSTKYLEKFKEEFNPHIIGLEQHYRCSEVILEASKALINHNPDPDRPSLITNNSIGEKIVHCTFSDLIETQEAENIIKLVRNLKSNDFHTSGKQKPSNTIAVLYRNHKFAKVLAEQLALKNEFQFRQWVQDTNPFQEEFNQAIVSYLSLAVQENTYLVDYAINFPEMCIDGLTIIQLKKLAKKKKIELIDVLKDIDAHPNEIGPLTQKNIIRFWNHVNKFVEDIDVTNDNAHRIVNKLLDILELLRSPYRNEEIKMIANYQDDMNISTAIEVLSRAVEQRERIYITAKYGIDEYCAAHILYHTLKEYLSMPVQIQYLLPDAEKPRISDRGINILVGNFVELDSEKSEKRLLTIGTSNTIDPKIIQLDWSPPTDNLSYVNSVDSITALRLCQQLIGHFERHNLENIVVYDLETTSVNPNNADIIQIAYSLLNTEGEVCKEDVTFVKPPYGKIPKEVTEITGISNEDVKDAQSIDAVLPEICNFFQDNILVGHNIAEYDNVILRRDLKHYLDRDFTNLHYDTLVTARRLFPNEKRRLQSLADKFKIEYNKEKLHSADTDIEINRLVFKELLSVESKNLEMKSLTELLPFVGCGILARIETSNDKRTTAKVNSPSQKREISSHINTYFNAAKRYIKTYRIQKILPNLIHQSESLLLETPEMDRVKAMIIQLSKDDILSTPEDLEWKKVRADVQKNVNRFEKISSDHGINQFIDYQTRMIDAVSRFEKTSNEGIYVHEKSKRHEGKEQLTLMSLHTAKGTEFDYVVIIGLEDGVFPKVWTWTPEAIEEERRLFYVGMTRAKKRLYLCTNLHRFFEQQEDGFISAAQLTTNSNKPIQADSEFIREIPSDFIQKWP